MVYAGDPTITNARGGENKTQLGRGTRQLPVFIKGEVTTQRSAQETKDEADASKEKSAIDTLLARYTGYAALFTFLLFLTAIAQAGLFVWQLRLMKAALRDGTEVAKAAKRSADASLMGLRPWLVCKMELARPPEDRDGVVSFYVRFIVTNIGHSPAMSVQFQTRITLSAAGFELPIVWLTRAATSNREFPVKLPGVATSTGTAPVNIGTDNHGLLLIPNESGTFQHKLNIKQTEIEAAWKADGGKDERHKTYYPIISGIITYTYSMAEVRADTAFVREIEIEDGHFELGKQASLTGIKFTSDGLWSNFAS